MWPTYLIDKNKHRLAKWGDRDICSKEGPRQNPRRSKWSGNKESNWQRAQANGQTLTDKGLTVMVIKMLNEFERRMDGAQWEF